MSPIENVAVIVFALLVLWLSVYFNRGSLKHGVVFTPILFSVLNLVLIVAPSLLFSSYFGFHPSAFPALVFLSAFLSLWLGFFAVGSNRLTVEGYEQTTYFRLISSQSVVSLRAVQVIMVGVMVLIGLSYYEGLPVTFYSLIATAQGEVGGLTKELQASRLALTKGAYFGGEERAQGLVTTAMELGWSLLIAYSAAMFANERTHRALVWLFFIVFLTWLFVAGTGSRAPFAMCCVCGLMAYSQVRPLSSKQLIAAFVVLIGVFVFLSSYTHRFQDIASGEASWLVGFQRVVERLIYGNGSNDALAILASQNGQLDYGVGYFHTRNFISAIPGIKGDLPLAYRLTEIYGGGATTFRTGTYISTLYVDFGIFGVAFVFGLMGAILRVMQNSLQPVRLEYWSIAVTSVLIMLAAAMITRGPIELLANIVVLVSLLAVHVISVIVARICLRSPSRFKQAL